MDRAGVALSPTWCHTGVELHISPVSRSMTFVDERSDAGFSRRLSSVPS